MKRGYLNATRKTLSIARCCFVTYPWDGIQGAGEALTNAHNDKEACEKAPEINNSRAGAFHEIVGIRCTTAYPIR